MEKGAVSVNWQDELRKLDDELASGRISADDYRVRRDQVLFSSNTSGQQAPGQQRWQVQPPSAAPAGPTTGSQATQFITPVGGGEPPTPAPNPDATQVVTPRPPDADRTQAVPSAGMGQPNYGPPSPAHGFQQPGPPLPPWQASDQAPPWLTQSNDNWSRSGPEVFDEASSGKGKKVFAIIGVILVIALIGGAVWWFGLRGGTGGTENTNAAPTTTSTTTKPKTPLELLPAAPGTADPNNGEATPDKLVTAGFLTQEEGDVLTTEGVQKIAFKGGKDGAFSYHAEVFETDSPEKATKLAADLAEAAGKSGMVDGARGALPPKAKVLQLIKPKQSGAYVVVYSTGKQVVRASTVQEPIGDADTDLIQKFQEYSVAVSRKFPAA